jgi:hypothetical protein
LATNIFAPKTGREAVFAQQRCWKPKSRIALALSPEGPKRSEGMPQAFDNASAIGLPVGQPIVMATRDSA